MLGLMPLDYLLSVVRDEDSFPSERMDAAKAAAPYVHPRMQPVTYVEDYSEARDLLAMTDEEFALEYVRVKQMIEQRCNENETEDTTEDK